MNILAMMSKIAGKLCLLDAINKHPAPIKKIVIIGFGTVGQAAFYEALTQKIPNITVLLTNKKYEDEIKNSGSHFILLDKQADLVSQQNIVKAAIEDANIVITSARAANQKAPLLIPEATLASMKKGSVVVDMALSEGGNVANSEHDATRVLGNGIVVTNISGYPKAVPHEASRLWSKASLGFILKIAEGSL